jgi:hypothetical protein
MTGLLAEEEQDNKEAAGRMAMRSVTRVRSHAIY